MKKNYTYRHTAVNPDPKPSDIKHQGALDHVENDLAPVPLLLSLRTQDTLVRCASVGGVTVDAFLQTALTEVLASEASTVRLGGSIFVKRGIAKGPLNKELADLAARLRGINSARQQDDQIEAARRGATEDLIQTLMACHFSGSKTITKEHIISRLLDYSAARAEAAWHDFAAWYSQRIAKDWKHVRGVEEAVGKILKPTPPPARNGYSVKFAKGAKRKKQR